VSQFTIHFQIQIFPLKILNQVIITTCKGASKIFIQVSHYKFTLLKIMSRKNSNEFTKFSPQGLNPFKIHVRFKLELFPNLYHEIQWEFEVGPIDKVVQFIQREPHAKFEYFWTFVRQCIRFCKFCMIWNIGNF
jgi:hypothetical protein